MTKKFLLLTLCLFILGTFISACGGGGKTTPPNYPFIPVPTPTISPTPEPTVSPTPAKYPIELSQTEFTVNIGETDNITVTLNGEDITQTATYTVDQEAIATVEAGLITGISVGIATVTVHAENAEADKTFTVNVIDPTLPSLEVNPTEVNLLIGEEATVTVTLEGKTVTEDVTYTVDDKSIANVEKGNIKAKYKGGTANVTVSLEGANSAVFKVNVTDDSNKEVPLNDEVLWQLGYIKSETHDIKKIKGDTIVTNLEIPATFQDNENKKYKIIAIGRAFEQCYSLKSVTIPDSVTHIGDMAFWNCDSLQSVTIPDSVTHIGDNAFDGCYSLKSVTIPDSVTHIGDWAFYCCSSLQNVTIGSGLTAIGRIFTNCSKLENVTISDNVLCIFPLAFQGCTKLTELTTKNGTIDITESESGIYTKNNVTFIDVKTKSNNITSVTIPDGVTEIPYGAFQLYDSLTNINIPDSVTSIEPYAFKACSSLESITIPKGVTSIENFAFENCTSLTSVTIKENSKLESIGGSAFYNCGYSNNTANLTLDIPDSVTSIGVYAFYNLAEITYTSKMTATGSPWGAKKVNVVVQQ